MTHNRRTTLQALFALAASGTSNTMQAATGTATATATAPGNSATFLSLAYEGQDSETPAATPAGQFRNPVLPGFFPDPSICRVGDDYYLASSTFSAFPGIAIHHSRDLVNWRLIGHAITRPESLRYAGLGISRGLFAPDISHHKGRWYLVCTMVGAGGNFVVTADQPEGPWSEPVWLGFEGIDPSLFFDEDENGETRAWMLNNGAPEGPPQYSGHRAIWLQAFDTQRLQMTGPRRVLVNGGVDISKQPVWIEGPHVYKRGGWYVLSAAEGGTSLEHSQVVLRSRSISGPYEPWAGNPTLTQRDLNHRVPGAVACTGHADFIEGPGGDWWAVFLGCRPLPDGHWLLGRETFLLPVQWTADGWPQILPAGQRVPLLLQAPPGAAAQSRSHDQWATDFRQQAPRGEEGWLTLRAPAPPLWASNSQGLQLQAAPDALNTLGLPAVLLRRVQHLRFTVRTSLQVPRAARTQASLVLFQSERQHDLFSVYADSQGHARLRLQRCDGGQLKTIAEEPLPADCTQVQLRVQADERVLRYTYALDAGPWQTLVAGLSHRPLSVQAAGDGNHFTGLLAGVHAHSLPAAGQ
jgi:xylan 1,4-beta-xylosidase